jgi:hypothetical protein
MSEPTITCPQCKHEIKLNESLAAPFMEKAQRDFESRILLVRQEEAEKAKKAASTDLTEREKELSELRDTLKTRDVKLAQAQKDQAEALRVKQEFEDAKRELDLNVQTQINQRLATVREEARKEAENEQKLKVSEKDLLISQMQQKIEELRRRSEQGSQQSQGEVLELELESLLRNKFLTDIIEPVAKGVSGADVTHKVIGNNGEHCGTILWEFKRTKNWSDGWLEKLREDRNKAKANVCIIASQSLPDTIKSFGIIDDVWVVHFNYIIPLAALLRKSLVELSAVRQSKVGQQTKTEMMYSYLTSNEFRLRVEAVVESISNLKEDLDTEKKAIMKQWAKREKEINKAIEAIVGMYGDMQGIAGKSLPEIKGLGFEGLENKE